MATPTGKRNGRIGCKRDAWRKRIAEFAGHEMGKQRSRKNGSVIFKIAHEKKIALRMRMGCKRSGFTGKFGAKRGVFFLRQAGMVLQLNGMAALAFQPGRTGRSCFPQQRAKPGGKRCFPGTGDAFKQDQARHKGSSLGQNESSVKS